MRICVCDAGPLTPNNDAGSRATFDAIATLRSLGHEVTFLPVSDLDDLREFDIFVASRPGPAVHAISVQGFGDIPSIFFGHDLHFLRMAKILDQARASAFQRLELMCWRAYDISLYPSVQEADYVSSAVGVGRAVAVPIYSMGDGEAGAVDKSTEPSCVFVGSAAHAPNQAAMRILTEDLWPRVRAEAKATLHLVGDWDVPREDMEELSIQVYSGVSETELNDIVTRSWVSLAPIPFGAGVKRKVIHALHCGTPVIGSRFAFQGLEKADGEVVGGLVADDSIAAATATLDLLARVDERTRLGEEGRAWVGSGYSPESVRGAWEDALSLAQRAFGERASTR